MGATTWGPLTRFEPRTWLLANGEVIAEPLLEQTSSGRKVRVAGTTDSVYSGELDELLNRAADTLAAQRGTHVWLNNAGSFFDKNIDRAGVTKDRASLHLLNEKDSTQCWWRFKDPESSHEVLVVVTLRQNGLNYTTQSFVTIPYRGWEQTWNGVEPQYVTAVNPDELLNIALSRVDDHSTWHEFCRDNPIDWPEFGFQHHTTPRAAVKNLLEAVRNIEDRATIQVPRLSHPYQSPEYREMELYGSNVNADFMSELTEYLDGAPTVERALELYQELLQSMRAAGIQVGDKKGENDFLAALLAGDRKSLNIPVTHLAEEGIENRDGNHRLTVHLPTGTFIVECDHREVDRNAVAEKWEEAKTMASLTGEEDLLLGYAKAYAQNAIKGRTERILQERTA